MEPVLAPLLSYNYEPSSPEHGRTVDLQTQVVVKQIISSCTGCLPIHYPVQCTGLHQFLLGSSSVFGILGLISAELRRNS